MLILKKIAVTGGLACGKTTVCQLFKERGAFVVNADDIVHSLLSFKTKAGQQVVALLGSDIVVNHQIDRNRISKIVFSDSKKLKQLEAILHPLVRKEIHQQFQQVQKQGNYPFLVAEIPLLYEIHMEQDFDAVIAVTADPHVAQQRFMQSTHRPLEEFHKRSAQQLPSAQKEVKADFVIHNNHHRSDLTLAVDKIIECLS